MAMGMSYDEYWHGDYTKLPYYRKAYAIQRKEANERLWLQGAYILQAIGSLLPKTDVHYPQEPWPLTQEEADEQEARRKQEEIDHARAYMETAMHKVNQKRREGGKTDGRDTGN